MLGKQDNTLADNRYARMTTAPVGKLIISMALPAIASQVINSLYNMTDTYFVSSLGTSATAAPGVVMPLLMSIQAISLAFALGSGSFAARALGSKDNAAANRSVSTAFFVSILVCLIIGVFSLIYLEPIMIAFGATPTILPFAYDYAFWIIIATPFFSAGFVLNQVIRQEGSVRLAVIGTLSGTVMNVVLDPILIFGFKMGIVGAAVATSIGQICSFCILFSFVLRGKSVLKISWKYFTPNWKTLSEILKIGLPDFFRTGLMSLAGVLLNNAVAIYGDAALAGMSVTNRIINLAMALLIGFGQGFTPMCGYCYGAKMYKRILHGLRFSITTAITIVIVFTVSGMLFAKPLMGLFRPEDEEFIRLGSMILRVQLLALPLATITHISNLMFQACGKAIRTSLVALSRNGLFFIPLIIILPRFLHFDGIIYAQPLADMLTFIISLSMMIGMVRFFYRETAIGPPAKGLVP